VLELPFRLPLSLLLILFIEFVGLFAVLLPVMLIPFVLLLIVELNELAVAELIELW
jgi:hypothetical protein